MAKDERLARHLHIPLQAGSDEILKKMNRHYTTQTFFNKIQRIRSIVGDVAITTDVIVGFPGESDELFAQSVAFIEIVNFAELHVFPYSVRTRTPAASFPGQVDVLVKKARVHTLLDVSSKLKANYAAKYVGMPLTALIETYDESSGAYFGHTSNYLDVYVTSEEDLTHRVVNIIYDPTKATLR